MPIFLHADFLHLGSTILFQLVIGTLMENMLGMFRTAIIYFLSGFLFSFLRFYRIGAILFGSLISNYPSVGASCYVFGLWGSFVISVNFPIGRNDNFKLGIAC